MGKGFHFGAFRRGFLDGLAVFSAATFAFLAVWRRFLKGDTDVLIHAKGWWWTEDEAAERARAILESWGSTIQ